MLKNRRILSIWFPRIGVERLMRREGTPDEQPMIVLRDTGNMQVIHSLNLAAEAKGLVLGQPYRDAMAMCPDAFVRLANPQIEANFLYVLARWAGQFSPWVALAGPAGLLVDLTGCAHLFGGEEALITQVARDCDGFGLTVQVGIADTVGAAWALSRYAGQEAGSLRTGDAIDQEARATRSRAAKRRHWERGGAAPKFETRRPVQSSIAEVGKARTAIAKLPIAALRLSPEEVTALNRLGLRRVEDVLGMPRAALARRFGRHVVQRLDQALGIEPEPISPAKPVEHFAVRLTLPEPIGLAEDIEAALDKLLTPLCDKLKLKGRGARRVRLELYRADETSQRVEVVLARASFDPHRLRPLLFMKIVEIDPGFGIDVIRLIASQTEEVHAHQHKGHIEASRKAAEALTSDTALDDLIGRLGARVGMDGITRLHPADSHIPEKTAVTVTAAWSEPAPGWPEQTTPPRPLILFEPELVNCPDIRVPPEVFRWRGRVLKRMSATGPERISAEWWLDDPNWRTGQRDYWRVETDQGERLWMYYAYGAAKNGGWFCHGVFG